MLSLFLCCILTSDVQLAPYSINLLQKRTLFANDEQIPLWIRLGNNFERDLKRKDFPDLLSHLTITRIDDSDQTPIPLERNQRYLERDLYRDVDNFPINAHKDFGIDLAQLCPEVRSGGVFQVQYTDPYYEVRAKPVRVSKQSLPDLSQWIRLETNRGPIDLKLMAMEAPNHARNFAILVAEGFYQNMIWHRVVKDFVIQTGDPTGTGEHGSEFTLDLEWSPFAKHNAYAVGMARAQAKDSADSQFYICLTEIRRLNKDYTVFAQVVGGHKVVDAIGNAPTSGNQGEPPNKPFEDITLDRAYFIPSGTADHTQGD